MKNFLSINGYNVLMIVVSLAVVVETAAFTLLKGTLNMYSMPIVWMVSGISVCFFAIWAHVLQRNNTSNAIHTNLTTRKMLAVWLPFIIGAMLSQAYLADIFSQFPIDPKSSDIIPALHDIYIDKFKTGQNIYAPFSSYGYTIYPNYLPLAWMPYFFSEIMQLDYRWTAYFVFITSIVVWNIRLLNKPFSNGELIFKAALPFLLLYCFIDHRETSFGHSVELTIVGFYLLLARTLFMQRVVAKVGGILLPLLSRFSFAFWLIYYGVLLLFNAPKRALSVIGLSALGVLFIYILPFFVRQPDAFAAGLAYYEKAALIEWHPHGWQAPDAIPFHLSQGASFSIFFYKNGNGTIEERLDVARLVHKLAAVGSVLLFGLLHFLLRKRIDHKFMALIGLKFSLLFFYGFFYVPFFYLFLVPTFLSLPILLELPLRSRYV